MSFNPKTINLFLASSNELKEDRERIEIEIRRKNDLLQSQNIYISLKIWENESSHISQTRKQDDYNVVIKDSDLFVLLAYTKVGMYTKEEFEIAYNAYMDKHRPKKIFTYFKDYNAPEKSLTDFKEYLEQGLKHFPESYKDVNQLWNHLNKEIDRYIKEIPNNQTFKTDESKIRHKLQMKKRMQRDFIDKDWFKKYDKGLEYDYDPRIQFNISEVYIRSIKNDTYPESGNSDQVSTWSISDFYGFYENGIKVWLSAAIGHDVLIDKEGFWDLLTKRNKSLENNPKYKVLPVKKIAKIPFHEIVDYDLDGDESTQEPHIFCKFQFDSSPYEKIYYELENDIFNPILDEKKRKDFLKEV